MRALTEQEKIDEQRADDEFRDKLLNAPCFCGAHSLPVKCIAHGYCAAHFTPVSAQMSEDQKTRLMKRAGWMQG